MKGRSKLIIVIAALLVTLLCIGAAVAQSGQSGKRPIPGGPKGESAASTAGRPSDGSKYTVTVFEGRVAIYLTEQMSSPKYVTDVPVSTLPAADRAALEEGIPIFTEEELTSILEDYGS